MLLKEDMIEEYVNQLVKIKEDWDNNPLNWSNNKRRMNGLRPIRGGKRSRRNLTNRYYHENKIEIYKLLEECIENIIINKDIFSNSSYYIYDI